MKRIGFALALFAVLPLGAKTLYFTANGDRSGGQWTWASSNNWSTNATDVTQTASIAEGDDLVIDRAASQFHAANAAVYVNSIRFTTKSLPYSGVSWNGFYLKEGGEGLIIEHTDSKSCYSTLYLDGEVKVNLKGYQYWQGGVLGRTAERGSRIIKLGTAQLNLEKVNKWNVPENKATYGKSFFNGATIREGSLKLSNDNGWPGMAFHFDGNASSAKFILGANITLKDGGLSSTEDLPLTNHGVSDESKTRTLTISGTPVSNNLYYAGGFYDTLSFAWTPSVPGQTFTAARATSTTTGNLTVSNGTFRIQDGAGFPNLTRIILRKGGVLNVAANAGEVDPDYVDVFGGVIHADADTVTEFLSVTTNYFPVADGDYTAANCDWVTGEGTVRVGLTKAYVNPIELDVANGVTKTLAAALSDYNSLHKEDDGFSDVTIASLNGGKDKNRTLVKKGLGVLRMTEPIKDYAGAIQVEAGVIKSEVRYSLGKDGTGAVPVYVHDGATFAALTTNAYMNVSRTLHISGSGAAGYGGALHCGADGVSGNYHLPNVFGGKLFLDGDATVHVGSWIRVADSVTLNHHTLKVVGNNTSYNDTPFHIPAVEDDGFIEVEKAEWRFETTEFNTTKPGNTVTFRNRGGWRYTNNAGTTGNIGNWKFIVKGPDSVLYSDYHIQNRNGSTANQLKVATTVDTLVSLVYQGDRVRGGLVVPVAVDGTGGFATSNGRNFYLHLMNRENSFTGGLSFQRGIIWAYENGTIPNGEDAGAVTLTPFNATYSNKENFVNYFDGIAFMMNENYTLPELNVEGTFPARVQNGQGAWKKITVNGDGGVHYYSSLGAPLLDVKKGTFKLPRAAGAGLWEGLVSYSSENNAAAAYAGTVVATNFAVRGPIMALQEEGFNYLLGSNNQLVTYTGYIWNRTGSDFTCSFASSVTRPVTIKIDGVTKLSTEANKLVGGNITLTPGPHRFEYRSYGNASAVLAPYKATGWKDKFGFVVDLAARNDMTAPSNYVAGVDSGDGSVFTRTDSPDDLLPVFDKIQLHAGTTLDVNGSRFVAPDISGAGKIVSTATDAMADGKIVIKKLTVDLAAQETLTSEIPVVLDEGFSIQVNNVATRIRKAHLPISAKVAITGATGEIPVTSDDGSLWSASLSADGRELTVRKSGLIIYLK